MDGFDGSILFHLMLNMRTTRLSTRILFFICINDLHLTIKYSDQHHFEDDTTELSKVSDFVGEKPIKVIYNFNEVENE